ncbi:lipopolysaccharide heptosyltransferase II [Luminiphilus sp.]|nr:lipopolysaccharide heptosyltransferase II [Luminiphilus sp.]
MTSKTTPSQVQKVLIIRLSAIGDIVMASGLIPALRERFPSAQIFWLADAGLTSLLENHTDLSGVISWDKNAWRSLIKRGQFIALIREVWLLSKTLRAHDFDLVIDAQGLLKSGLLALLSGSSKRVSFRGSEYGHIFSHEVLKRDFDDPRMSSEYRQIGSFLGCDDSSFKLGLTPSHTDWERARELIHDQDSDNPKPIIAIAPFTTRPQKHWPTHYWPELIRRVVEKGWKVVMLGGPTDYQLASSIESDANVSDCLLNLVGKTSLMQSYAIIEQSSALVGVDTGLTHMGIAATTPTVAIFGSTCPYLKPLSSTSAVIYEGLACSPCHRKPSCGGTYDCLSQITPQKAYESLEAIL